MKAADILLYLFIFNMFIWVITSGLDIYNFTAQVSSDYQLDKTYTALDIFATLLQELDFFNVKFSGVAILIGLIVTGAMLGIMTSGQGAAGAVYGAFTAFFFASLARTLGIFFSLTSQVPGTVYVFIIFGIIAGVLFLIGLFQMVTGGWKSFK